MRLPPLLGTLVALTYATAHGAPDGATAMADMAPTNLDALIDVSGLEHAPITANEDDDFEFGHDELDPFEAEVRRARLWH